MEALPAAVLSRPELSFMTPSEVVAHNEPKDSLDVPNYISWRDEGCDIQGWLGNEMQKDAISNLYQLTDRVRKIDDQELQHTFERLQTSDYFHFMSTRWFSESRPDRPSPFYSPYDAYISYMNILEDFKARLKAAEDLAQKEQASEPPLVKEPEQVAEIPQPTQPYFKTCIRHKSKVTPLTPDSQEAPSQSQSEVAAADKVKKTVKKPKKIAKTKKKTATRPKKKV